MEEIKQIHKHGVYNKVPITQCWEETKKAPIRVKWLDINKGDEENEELRSRLVAMEFNKEKRLDLFAPTPPLEILKLIISMAVTKGIGFGKEGYRKGMKIDFIDISRAFFHAPALRRVYVDLPAEDQEEGMCGMLEQSMYGTRDAAQNWANAYMEFMKSIGFKKGDASPCAFKHETRNLRAGVHGDDFTILGYEEDLDWFWKEIQERFECKHRGRLGPDKGDQKEIRVLNRIITWTDEGIEYEGDQRHVEIAMQRVGIHGDSREVRIPVEKRKATDESKKLEPEHATNYRGIVARLNFLGQDRSQIQYAIKELSKDMADPSEDDWGRMKKLVRFLKGQPRYIMEFKYQENPKGLSAWSDSDFAGCMRSRKSTSGGLVCHGSHVIRSWSTNQAVIALSSGEAEYYAMVKATSQAIGIKNMMRDLGEEIEEPISIKTDASAAIGIVSRIGVGKVRHIEVNQLWLQEKVYKGEVVIEKVDTKCNLADALTKPLSEEDMATHVAMTGSRIENSRHPIAPRVENM